MTMMMILERVRKSACIIHACNITFTLIRSDTFFLRYRTEQKNSPSGVERAVIASFTNSYYKNQRAQVMVCSRFILQRIGKGQCLLLSLSNRLSHYWPQPFPLPCLLLFSCIGAAGWVARSLRFEMSVSTIMYILY